MRRVILVVDDDPSIRALIATTLEDVADFRLVEVPDGQRALEAAAELRRNVEWYARAGGGEGERETAALLAEVGRQAVVGRR